MPTSKKLLVTGATGFLGSHLVVRWVADGHKIAVLKRRSSSLSRIETLLHDIQTFDVEDGIASVFEQFGTIDAVVHCACSYGRNGESPEEIFAANSSFALSLLEAAANNRVPFFINTGTVLERFLNPYALSKLQFAEWGYWFAKSNRIRFVDVRLEHMFGAGDDTSKFTTHVIASCLENVPELALTAGEQRRDFIYIDDVVDAYSLLLDRAYGLENQYSYFGLGSGAAVTVREFVETVHALSNSRTLLKFGAMAYRSGEVMNSEADITALLALGWEPKYSISKGLDKTIKQERASRL